MMTNFTSQMKKYLIRATLLFLSVVAFLCPLDNALAYEIGTFKYSLTVVGMNSNESVWTKNNSDYWSANTASRQYWNIVLNLRGTPAVPKDSYIVFDYFVFNSAASMPDVCPTSSNYFSVVNCTTTYALVDTEGTFTTYGYQVDTDGRGGWLYPSTMPTALTNTWQGQAYLVTAHQLVLKVNNDISQMATLNLGGIFASRENTSSGTVFIRFSGINVFDQGTELSDILQYLEEHPDSAGAQMEQNKQETQQAQNDAQSAGNTAQSDASSAGQTLLGALTSFIGAITNASPGNCSLTLNTGYGFNLGEVNLCSISPPASFQVISSLVVIGFAVPLSISASKKMIELFRGFTG